MVAQHGLLPVLQHLLEQHSEAAEVVHGAGQALVSLLANPATDVAALGDDFLGTLKQAMELHVDDIAVMTVMYQVGRVGLASIFPPPSPSITCDPRSTMSLYK